MVISFHYFFYLSGIKIRFFKNHFFRKLLPNVPNLSPEPGLLFVIRRRRHRRVVFYIGTQSIVYNQSEKYVKNRGDSDDDDDRVADDDDDDGGQTKNPKRFLRQGGRAREGTRASLKDVLPKNAHTHKHTHTHLEALHTHTHAYIYIYYTREHSLRRKCRNEFCARRSFSIQGTACTRLLCARRYNRAKTV